MANLKTEEDKLDIEKLATVPVDLSKLSNLVKNDVIKKTVYDTLVAKIDNIDTSGLAKKADCNTKISEIEDKIPDSSSFVKKNDCNTKVTEIEDKIPDISGLATKTALTKVENKIHSISGLVNLQANLITKTDFDAKLSNLNRKITGNKIKHILNDNDLSYYRGKEYFDEGSGKQNYLVFLPMGKYFKLNSVVGVIDRVLSWQSKGISNESIKPPTTSNNSLNPTLSYNDTEIKVQFTGSCLKQRKFTFTHKKVVNIYIVYELGASSSNANDPTIKKLFIWCSYFN